MPRAYGAGRRRERPERPLRSACPIQGPPGPPTRMNAWNERMQRLLRWVAGLLGLAALLFALGIGAFRLAIETLPGYQERIVERVRDATGLTLEFDSVHGRIGRYGPEIVFRG